MNRNIITSCKFTAIEIVLQLLFYFNPLWSISVFFQVPNLTYPSIKNTLNIQLEWFVITYKENVKSRLYEVTYSTLVLGENNKAEIHWFM